MAGPADTVRAAADWLMLEPDDGGPGYHAPDGSAWYDGAPWAASWLRHYADQLDHPTDSPPTERPPAP